MTAPGSEKVGRRGLHDASYVSNSSHKCHRVNYARCQRDVFIALMTVTESVKASYTIALTIVGITIRFPIPTLFTFLRLHLYFSLLKVSLFISRDSHWRAASHRQHYGSAFYFFTLLPFYLSEGSQTQSEQSHPCGGRPSSLSVLLCGCAGLPGYSREVTCLSCRRARSVRSAWGAGADW